MVTTATTASTNLIITLHNRAKNTDVTQDINCQLIAPLGRGVFGLPYLVEPISEADLEKLPEYLRPSFTVKFFSEKAAQVSIPDTSWEFLEGLDPARFAYPIASFSPDAELLDRKVKVAVMPYLPGREFFDYIADQREVINADQRKDLALQTCALVKKMHEARVMHRDLKTENFILSREGTLGVIDFDFSRPMDCQINTCRGSACYMAPEIILRGCLKNALPEEEGLSDEGILKRQDILKKIELVFSKVVEINEKIEIWSLLSTLLIIFSRRSVVLPEEMVYFTSGETEKFKRLCELHDGEDFTKAFEVYQTQFFQEFQSKMFFNGLVNIYQNGLLSYNLFKFFKDAMQMDSTKRPTIEEIENKLREDSAQHQFLVNQTVRFTSGMDLLGYMMDDDVS